MIGYYVHHHGGGHRQRLATIAGHLRSRVTGLSSLPPPPGWQGEWVTLPLDTDGSRVADGDPSAGGVLHWAPRYHAGVRGRMGAVAQWIAANDPDLIVADVSVEIALLARVMGVPVAVSAMTGDRFDRPHVMAYDLADRLLAPWPRVAAPTDWPESWLCKTDHVGAFSRLDSLQHNTAGQTAGDGSRSVLMLWGSGGSEVSDSQRAAAQAMTPEWRWTFRIDQQTSDAELWRDLQAAAVVVVHGGHNAVAEVATARRPAVVVAQARPHDEQVARIVALQRSDIGVPLLSWPDARRWPALLTEAVQRGGRAWSTWSPGDGAQRYAAALDALVAARPLREEGVL